MKRDVYDRLAAQLAKLDPLHSEYYIDSDVTDAHPDHTFSFCFKHAKMVAFVETFLEGAQMFVSNSWGDSDHIARCAWYRCDKALRGGGLTDHAIDSALALTEERPLECPVSPSELVLVWESMSPDDRRWQVWLYHACVLLKKPVPAVEVHKDCGGVILMNDRNALVSLELSRCSRCRNKVTLHDRTQAWAA